MKVKPRCEPKKVKISGPAFTDKGVPASIPTDLIIDPTQAGFGDLEVQVMVSFVGWVAKTFATERHIYATLGPISQTAERITTLHMECS